MSGTGARVGVLGLLASCALFGGSSCANLLVGEYTSAAEKVCACGDPTHADACAEATSGRLESISSDAARDWVQAVADGECTCRGCLQQEPICKELKEACSVDVECCSNDERSGSPYCGEVFERGRMCRKGCWSCSDFLLPPEQQPPRTLPLCFFTGVISESFATCICEACADECRTTVACGGQDQISSACEACVRSSVGPRQACTGSFQECIKSPPT